MDPPDRKTLGISRIPGVLSGSGEEVNRNAGTELADYARIQAALETTLYFCDPHSPWQRGSNENTNRLLRFWFEKGPDLAVHTPEDLRRAAKLNRRPRPTLNLETPANRLNHLTLPPG